MNVVFAKDKGKFKMRRFLIIILILIINSVSVWPDDDSLEIFDKMKSLIISVSETIKPAVVHIEVVKKKRDQRYESMGSGLVIDGQGYTLTKHNVVENYI